MDRTRRLSPLRARAERGSTEGERAAARRALTREQERVHDEPHPEVPGLDAELGEVGPGIWPARDRDGRGVPYQAAVPHADTARDWFARGAMCTRSGGGPRFVARASGFSLPNSSGGPPPLAYFVRWRDLPNPG